MDLYGLKQKTIMDNSPKMDNKLTNFRISIIIEQVNKLNIRI